MELRLKEQIKNYSREAELLDGQRITIRAITSNDRKSLRSFYSRLSKESKFFRYLYAKDELTEEDLDDFCEIDYYDSLGLAAERVRAGQKEIIGVGRFYRLPDCNDTAEIAFVVQDDEQRKGIGTHLLKHLAVLAWGLGVRVFLGELFRENARMISILRKADNAMSQEDDDETTCVVKLEVSKVIKQC